VNYICFSILGKTFQGQKHGCKDFGIPYRFNLLYNRTRLSAGLGEGKFSESYLLYNFVKTDIKYPQV